MPSGQLLPFKGFTPSVDPTTPGAVLNCSNMVPTIRGMKGAAAPVAFGNPAFPSAVTGAATCELLTGNFRTFAGTGTDLYEVVDKTNQNVSAVAGGYTGGANPWRFIQFGNATVGTNGSDPLQQSVSSGPFSPIGDVGSITIVNPGSGYYVAPTVTLTGGGGSGATAVASITSSSGTAIGGVLGLTLGAAGTGYTSAPTVTLSPPPAGGTQATATATVSGGVVTGFTVTEVGAGYVSPPTASITGGGGSGATATVQLATGTVTAITVEDPGEAYTGTPTVTISGGGGTGATATAVMNQPPVANIIAITQGFVFAFGTNDPVYGSRPHGWWCSGLYDQTQWTPSQSTQCENGIIIDQPGAITAGWALGTNIIVYKANSMFYGVYEGPPVVWAFNQISPIVGTPCQECVVPVGSVHYFLGTDKQVYVFDGTIPQPIGDKVHDWLVENWASAYQSQVQSYYDEPNSLIYWYFVSNNSSTGTLDTCLVFNHRTGEFGRADFPIQATVQAISGQITWQDMGSLPGVTTWATLPQIPYNSSYWNQAAPSRGVIDSTNTLQSMNGASANSSITTGWLGDDYNYIDYLGVVPRFSQVPTTCTGLANTQPQLGLGAIPTQWPIGPFYDGELACDFSARYAQFQFNFTGDHEIIGMTPRVDNSGEI